MGSPFASDGARRMDLPTSLRGLRSCRAECQVGQLQGGWQATMVHGIQLDERLYM